MSYLDPIASPEADLRRRLQSQPTKSLDAQVKDLQTADSDIHYKIEGHTNRLNAHDEQLASHASRIAGVESSVVSLDTRVAAAEGTIITHGNRITALEALPMVVATTEAEILAAVAVGKWVLAIGIFNLTQAIQLTVPRTRVWGVKGLTKFVRPHVNGSAVNVFEISTWGWQIKGVEITTNHPLTSDTGYHPNDTGIQIDSNSAVDWSGGLIEDVYIHHVGWGIRRWPGSAASAPAIGVTLRNVRIESFCRGGLELNWRMRHLRLENVYIYGRVGAESHVVYGNGIWVGNYCDELSMDDVYVTEVDRLGVEVWNSRVGPVNTGGNSNPVLHNVRCGYIGRNPQPAGSFGLSVIGTGVIKMDNCHVDRAFGIGMEFFNDEVNNGRYQCSNLSVNLVESDGSALGFSMDSQGTPNLLRGQWSNCFIGHCESTNGATESYGVQMIGGCNSVILENFHFRDAGNRQLYVNGDGVAVFRALQVRQPTFEWTADAPTRGYNVSCSLQNLLARAVLKNAVVQRNTGALVGYYRINGTGSVLTGGAAYAAIVASGPDLDCQGESNLLIDL